MHARCGDLGGRAGVTKRSRRPPHGARLQLVDPGACGEYLVSLRKQTLSQSKQILVRRIGDRKAMLERFARLPMTALDSGEEQPLQG